MERGERFYYIHRKLKGGACLPMQHFLDALEISRATFKRDIEYLRDRYRAPLIYDRDHGGYRYARDSTTDARFELPGLWFSPEELHGLLTMNALIEELGDGLLGEPLALLRDRLAEVLGEDGAALAQLQQRVRVFHAGVRRRQSESLPLVAQAMTLRRQLHIRYWARSSDAITERDVSPQRLIHYRGNWYLDAWCHLRDGLRNFAVDAISHAEMRDSEALDIDDATLQHSLGGAYGIFSGAPDQWAELRFDPERARWVRDEIWHSEQVGEMAADGSYLLKVPYHHDEELIMDILRHGRHVTVLAPASLAKRVAAEAVQPHR